MLPSLGLAAFGFILTANHELSGLGMMLCLWGILLAIAHTD